MSVFWDLVSCEYKKIFKRRGAVITLIIAVMLSLIGVFGTIVGSIYVNGEPVISKYEDMTKDLEYAKELSGRAIDKELIMEAVREYSALNGSDGAYYLSDGYRKYSAVYDIVNSVYGCDFEEFCGLTEDWAESFYEIRRQYQESAISQLKMSDKAKRSLLDADKQIDEPFIFEPHGGFYRFFVIMYTTGIILAVASAIIFAPIFSGEYTSGADSLILSSKYGKNLLVWAKIFVMVTFLSGIAVILAVLTFTECAAVWGADGANAAIQLMMPMSPYPLNMVQCAVIYFVCILAACIMTAALTALLSAGIKTPFGTIVVMSVIIIAPMMINVSENNVWLYKLSHLLPSNMMAFWSVMDNIQFELFGLVIRPYIFMPVIGITAAVIFSLLAYRIFGKRQAN